MGANMFYLAVTLFCVLGGACLVKATDNATSTPSNETETVTDGNSSSGSSGNMLTMVTETTGNNMTSGGGTLECLVCTGGKESTCDNYQSDSDMTGITMVESCQSCRVHKIDTGKDTNLTQIARTCDLTDPCPLDLADPKDFMCSEIASIRTCKWCCTSNNCNNFNRNGGNALVAGLVIDGWPTTKLLYGVMSAMAVSMSIPTMG